MNEKCRLISESQWIEYKELIKKNKEYYEEIIKLKCLLEKMKPLISDRGCLEMHKDEIKSMIDNKCSYYQIAKKFCVSYKAVSFFCNKNNLLSYKEKIKLEREKRMKRLKHIGNETPIKNKKDKKLNIEKKKHIKKNDKKHIENKTDKKLQSIDTIWFGATIKKI